MKEIPHIIDKTGIGADSFHPYQSRINYFYIGGIQEVIQHSRQHPISRYTERFPPAEFCDVVTNKNRERVAQLDELANKSNKTLTHDGCTLEEFARIVKRACEIIYDDPGRVVQLREIFPGIEV